MKTSPYSTKNPEPGTMRAGPGIIIFALAAWAISRPVTADMTVPRTFSDVETIDRLEGARGVLEAAIADRAFPGCAFAVGTSEKLHACEGLGRFAYDLATVEPIGLTTNPRCTSETLFDLASLTKVIGTTTVVLTLVRDEKLRLSDKVVRWLPRFAKVARQDGKPGSEGDPRRAAVTVEQLLVHASGLPAWRPFYRSAKSYRDTIELALKTPLETAPGELYRYSDVGFILLGEIASRAGGAPLRDLERQRVFAPLGIEKAMLRSPPRSLHASIPPTEIDPTTSKPVHGVVHDENCRGAEGATGHAGLFASSKALAVVAQEYLRALRGDSEILPEKLTRRFVARRELIEGSSRAIGWDTPSGMSSGGDLISTRAFGHTGFTGTSIWIDPERDLFLVLLSHRVHPTRANRKISAVRRAFADAAIRALDPDAKPIDRTTRPKRKRS